MKNHLTFTWSPVIGIARTILATGTFMTLLINPPYVLFSSDIIELSGLNRISLFFILQDHLMVAKILSLILLAIIAIGIYPRFTAIIHWYVSYSFFSTSNVIDGGDHIASLITLLLIPILLFDQRKTHWDKGYTKHDDLASTISSSFYFLIKVQACVIYLHAMVGKLSVYEWLNGTAAYYWLTHEYFGINSFFRGFTEKLLENSFIVIVFTWGTLILEFLLSAAIILDKHSNLRYYLFFGGIIFHFGIVIFHGLASFFFSMTSVLILYLIPYKLDIQLSLKNIT